MKAAISFSTQEYGKQGTFVRDGNQFEIWITKLEQNDEGTLGIIGQQWRYREGELVPTDHPILRRWYSYSFQSERGATMRDPRIPYLWLANPKVEAYAQDPRLESSEIINVEDGAIQTITRKRIKVDLGDRRYRFQCSVIVNFNPDRGESRSYTYPTDRAVDDIKEPSKLKTIAYFGDWSSHRIYPIDYLPPDPENRLKDKRGKLITYKTSGEYPYFFKVLWIL